MMVVMDSNDDDNGDDNGSQYNMFMMKILVKIQN